MALSLRLFLALAAVLDVGALRVAPIKPRVAPRASSPVAKADGKPQNTAGVGFGNYDEEEVCLQHMRAGTNDQR